MAITTIDGLFVALKNSKYIPINKATRTGQLAGGQSSMWGNTGVPTAGITPTTASICDDTTVGALILPTRSGAEERVFGYASLGGNTATQTFFLEDRLGHMGGLNGTLTTAQTVNLSVDTSSSNMVDRIDDVTFNSVEWYLEWYTTTGATTTTPTVNVTYQDNSSGNIVMAAIGTSVGAGRRIPITPINGKNIKTVNTVQLSATTGTAGNFGVTAVKNLAPLPTLLANKLETFDWSLLKAVIVKDSACLQFGLLSTATGTGTLQGYIALAVG